VPILLKISVFVIFFLLSGFSAVAEELWRLRYSVPTEAESQIKLGSTKATGKLNTSGHGVNLVFANGIGLGYSTVRSNGRLEGVSYLFKNNCLDLSYTIGNSLSFTLGAGLLINGRGELSFNGVSHATENSTGEAVFMNFGIPFFGGELLLGYRQNITKYKNFQSQVSGQSVTLANSAKLISDQINVGIGFLF